MLRTCPNCLRIPWLLRRKGKCVSVTFAEDKNFNIKGIPPPQVDVFFLSSPTEQRFTQLSILGVLGKRELLWSVSPLKILMVNLLKGMCV